MALPNLRTADIGGRRLAWREAGSGPALVLLHGIGGHSGCWQPQFEAFSASHRVIAWDAPGYGGSGLEPRPAGIEDYAAAIEAFLEHVGAGPATMLGHSLGAVMIAALCRRDPSLVRKAVFLHGVSGGGALDPEQREAMRLTRIRELEALGPRGFAEQRGKDILGRKVDPNTASAIVDVMAQVPVDGYVAAWSAMCAADIFPDLSCLDCPAMVVCGSDDPVAPEKMCRAVAEKLPLSEFVLLDGVGHFGLLEAPDEVNDLVRGFLEGKP